MGTLLNGSDGFIPSKIFFFIIAVVSFLFMAAWEFLSIKKRVNKEIRVRSYLTNLINLVFNNLIMLLISVQFFYALANIYSLNIFPRLGKLVGIEINSPLGIAIQFIILDFLIYIWHIINHKFDFLWNFHKAHHCDHDLNTSTGIRFHIGELLLSLFYKGIIVLILGIPPEIMIAFEFITIYAALFHHSNIKVPGESLLCFLFIMPSHHATHHSVPRQYHDSNYGVFFSIWDYVLRTRNPHQPNSFGLAQIPEMSFPQLFRFSLTFSYIVLVVILLSSLFLVRWYWG